MAEGDKPYRLYRGGRKKGRVPLGSATRQTTQPARAPGSGGRRRRRWGLWIALAVVGLLLLALVWGILGYRSFASGVDKANGRLPRGAKAQLAKRDRSLLSEPTTILVIGTDGGRARRARGREPLGLADARPHRPRHAPGLVPLDPARSPRGDTGLRIVQDQRREPDRRPGADARDRQGAHRPSDRPRRRRRLRRVQGADRRDRRHRGERAEADPLQQVRLPVQARALREVGGLALRQGEAAHGRTARARLLADPDESARPVGHRHHAWQPAADRRRRRRRRDRERRHLPAPAVQGRHAGRAARDRPLGVGAGTARLGAVPLVELAALSTGRRAELARRRIGPPRAPRTTSR